MGILSIFGISPKQPVALYGLILLGDGCYEREVVGESHYQDALERICGGRTDASANLTCLARLSPEPTNPHDRNAIRVNIDAFTVGYLSRKDAARYCASFRASPRPLQPVWCNAIIRGGWDRGSRGSGSFGVWLDFTWPIAARPRQAPRPSL